MVLQSNEHTTWVLEHLIKRKEDVELLAEQGLANRVNAHLEAWNGFLRAGASMIISYGARHAREWLGR